MSSSNKSGGAFKSPTPGSTIPLALLREAIGHVVAVELVSKDEYRGTLKAADGNMNVTLSQVIHTAKDDSKSRLEEVFLKGGSVRFFILPDLLVNAPILSRAAQLVEGAQRAAAPADPAGGSSHKRAASAALGGPQQDAKRQRV